LILCDFYIITEFSTRCKCYKLLCIEALNVTIKLLYR